MFTDLAIILVNWNLKDDTTACIESLLNSGAAHSQIIVVDNGSTDGSAAELNERYHHSVLVIESDENLGYAAGVNMGINYALSHDYKWLLLLNNDTIVADDFIDSLCNGSETENYAIFSPLIFYHENPTIIWSMGEKFIPHTLLTLANHKNRAAEKNMPKIIPIDVTNGCAMMVNREVFERIGLFDSKLFMYGEEVDFCWRAKQAGFKFACLTQAHIWHKISKSSQNDRPTARYLRIRNQILFYRRYAPAVQKPFYILFSMFRLARIATVDIIKGTAALLKPSFVGWLDGWFADPGKNG